MLSKSNLLPLKPAPSVALILATVLLPFALGHFVSYLFRTVNAVVYADLARDMALGANSLGLLTGAYFFAFAAMQLPVGIALDRFGPRKVQIPLMVVAALGAVWFAHANSLSDLVLARGLIGLGVAGSLMAAIKACSIWLPPERLPMATSLLLSVGGLGAMASTSPMQMVLTHTDWRGAFIGLAVTTLVVGSIIWGVVPEHTKKQPQTSMKDMVRAVGQLYSSSSFWRLALYSLLAHATYMAVQGLWLGPWLRDVGGLSRTQTSHVLFVASFAMVLGSLTFGWLTDRLRVYGVKPIMVCGTGIAIFLMLQGLMLVPFALPPFWVAVGFSFFGTAATMNYAIVAQSVPAHLTGRVSTSFNLLVFLLAFVVQWGIGGLINLWIPVDGVYPVKAYQLTLAINLALQIPGLLLWISLRPWRLVESVANFALPASK
jgi:predicted MFS family arabinose efflux permease